MSPSSSPTVALVAEIKTALDELRMQMLGLQVLFGFQFQGLFQAGFDSLPMMPRIFDAFGIFFMVIALTALMGIPCQHRIVEQGDSSRRLFRLARLTANFALFPLAMGIGCDLVVATARPFGPAFALVGASLAVLAALFAWYGLPHLLEHRASHSRGEGMERATTPLHAKIEQMLTEARVILPGSQALLGFQFIVMLTPAFSELSSGTRYVHLAALLFDLLSILLLICPAAVHRITFEGKDDPRMHRIGSTLVTAALLPLAVSIALDVGVALLRLFDNKAVAAACAATIFLFMAAVWYVVPWMTRKRIS